ncbi:MAG: hypothetical protein EPN79_10945 [Burkholderiaceae bacterium]|nr:MAG: hypothetical protein EPN79_10945 [Burkholderiaceae bacterium]
MTSNALGAPGVALSPIGRATGAGSRAGADSSAFLYARPFSGKPLIDEALKLRLAQELERLWQAGAQVMRALLQMLLNFLRAIFRVFRPGTGPGQAGAEVAPGASGKIGKKGKGEGGDPVSDQDLSDIDGSAMQPQDAVPANTESVAAAQGMRFGDAVGEEHGPAGNDSVMSAEDVHSMLQQVHQSNPDADELLRAGGYKAFLGGLLSSQASILNGHLAEVNALQSRIDSAAQDVDATDAAKQQIGQMQEKLQAHRQAAEDASGRIRCALEAAGRERLDVREAVMAAGIDKLMPDWEQHVQPHGDPSGPTSVQPEIDMNSLAIDDVDAGDELTNKSKEDEKQARSKVANRLRFVLEQNERNSENQTDHPAS